MSDNKLEVLGEKSGPLSFKQKLFLKVAGMFCIWLGKALMHIENFEQFHQLEKQFEEKANSMDDLNKKLIEDKQLTNQEAEEFSVQFCKRQKLAPNEKG